MDCSDYPNDRARIEGLLSQKLVFPKTDTGEPQLMSWPRLTRPLGLVRFEIPRDRVEHRARELLGDALPDRAALHDRRAGHRLDRDVPPIARDPLGAILEMRRLTDGGLRMARRHVGGDGRAIDQHAHGDDEILVDRPIAVIKP